MTNSKRHLLLVLGIITCLANPLAAFAQTALDTIIKAKLIRIGVPVDVPPFGFVGADMQPQGLDIDVAKLVAQKLGVKAELMPVVSANRIPALQTKKIDLIVSTLGKNEERMKIINFTHAYAPGGLGLFANKDVVIKSFADLAGKSVAVARGAMEDELVTQAAPPSTIIKRFEDQAATKAAFTSGQTQAIGTTLPGGAVIAQRQSSVELKLPLRESPAFMGVAKGEDALLAKINEIVLAAKADGTLNRLSQKWLKRDAGELPL
ncbi:MAG: amino acid transporter substrate-binding protein [Proteobacteria bacterium]|nr:amino acid transporter substrate-binding protein [Pseudomonadota bacterium]